MSVEHHSLYLGQKGRILLPVELRKKLQLSEGDRLIATVAEDGTVTLVPARVLVQKDRGCMNPEGKPSHAVEEILEQRRKEVQKEQKQWRKRSTR